MIGNCMTLTFLVIMWPSPFYNGMTLTFSEKPPRPDVIIHDEGATQMEFWITEPIVNGPEVTQFIVTYKLKGGTDDAMTTVVDKGKAMYKPVSEKATILEAMTGKKWSMTG